MVGPLNTAVAANKAPNLGKVKGIIAPCRFWLLFMYYVDTLDKEQNIRLLEKVQVEANLHT